MCEDHGVQLCNKFLAVGIEHSCSCNQEAWQCHKDDFEDGFADKTCEMYEVGVGAVVLESAHCCIEDGDIGKGHV